tara:strand:- start:44 stop:520 length:477 start_codon:yes stop_codon:yes gene_type:complete
MPDEERQEILTNIVPETGFSFLPEYIGKIWVEPVFFRTLSHLVGKTDDGAAAVEVTSSGSLKVADTGSGLEVVTVYTGTSNDDYESGQTHEYTTADDISDILVEGNDVIVSFKNEAGTWSSDIILPAGTHHREIVSYGFKVKSRYTGQAGFYQYEGYR